MVYDISCPPSINASGREREYADRDIRADIYSDTDIGGREGDNAPTDLKVKEVLKEGNDNPEKEGDGSEQNLMTDVVI
jgi:hypothetical protein